jgi:hypothetical protein
MPSALPWYSWAMVKAILPIRAGPGRRGAAVYAAQFVNAHEMQALLALPISDSEYRRIYRNRFGQP